MFIFMKGADELKLTIKQKRFADEYIISGNAYDAAIKAGYAINTAKNADKNILENRGVKSYIDERLKELEDKAIAKQDEVLKFLTSVLRNEQTEEVLYGMGEGMQGKTRIEISAKDKIKAAELLGKRYGTWTDKVDVNAEVRTVIVDDLEDS